MSELCLYVACALDQMADEDFGEGADGEDDGGGDGLGESLIGYLRGLLV